MHPDLRLLADLALGLSDAAEFSARRLALQMKTLRRGNWRRGVTLRPGVDTPLWNELVRQALPRLRRRGAKAHLARLLGVPRQRLQVCLKARTGCLDAERTLLLLCWLARPDCHVPARGRNAPKPESK